GLSGNAVAGQVQGAAVPGSGLRVGALVKKGAGDPGHRSGMLLVTEELLVQAHQLVVQAPADEEAADSVGGLPGCRVVAGGQELPACLEEAVDPRQSELRLPACLLQVAEVGAGGLVGCPALFLPETLGGEEPSPQQAVDGPQFASGAVGVGVGERLGVPLVDEALGLRGRRLRDCSQSLGADRHVVDGSPAKGSPGG